MRVLFLCSVIGSARAIHVQPEGKETNAEKVTVPPGVGTTGSEYENPRGHPICTRRGRKHIVRCMGDRKTSLVCWLIDHPTKIIDRIPSG